MTTPNFHSAVETMQLLYESDPSLKYREGKIYKLTTPDNPKLCYVGYTTISLAERLRYHCSDFDRKIQIQSKEILKYRHFTIELLEEFPCATKEEILGREYYWMEKLQEQFTVVSLVEDQERPGTAHPLDIPRDHPLKQRKNIFREWYTDAMKYRESIIYGIVSSHSDYIYIGSTIHSLRYRLMLHCVSYDNYQRTKNKKYSCRANELLKYPEFTIVLLERYPCVSKEELWDREAYWIQMFDNIVNKNIPGRTAKIRYEQYRTEILKKRRERYEADPEYYKVQRKEWRMKNRDLIREYKREYRLREPERHKTWWQNYVNKHGMDHIRQQARDYYAKNREHILALAAARREKTRDATRKYNRERYAINKDHINERRRENYDPEKRKERSLIKHICECGIEIVGDNLASHRATMRHQNIIIAMAKIENGETVTKDELKGNQLWKCEICQESYLIQFKQKHLNSVEHKEREAIQIKSESSSVPILFRGIQVPNFWSEADTDNSTDIFIMCMCMDENQLVDLCTIIDLSPKTMRKKNGIVNKRDRVLAMIKHWFGEFSLDKAPSKDRFCIESVMKQWCSVCCEVYSDSRVSGGGTQASHNNSEKHREARKVPQSKRTNTPCEIQCECGEYILRGKTYQTHLSTDTHTKKISRLVDDSSVNKEMQLRLDRLSGVLLPMYTGDRTQKVVCCCGQEIVQSAIRSTHMKTNAHKEYKRQLEEYCEERDIEIVRGVHVYLEDPIEQRINEHIYNLTQLDPETIMHDQVVCSCGHLGKKASLKSHMKNQHETYYNELPDEYKT